MLGLWLVLLAAGQPAAAGANSDVVWTITGRGRLQRDVEVPPDAFLCRLTPDADRDVVQLSIGRVASRRCNALYSPSIDTGWVFTGPDVELTWAHGRYRVTGGSPLSMRVVHEVYRVGHRLKWFKPLDKSVFRRAPAGWCTWYIYWQNVDESETVKNTDWLATNLRPFGYEYVQIDDGWQTKGHGNGENRDWFVTFAKQFPHGMKWLADAIRQRGFKPGIWLCPFGESDAELFAQHPELFVRRPDGTSIGEEPTNKAWPINWVGRYFVDPSTPAGQDYLRKLFVMLCDEWGYDYVKIDGQGGMAGTYSRWQQQLGNAKLAGDEAYRAGLAAMKQVMGPQRFLLNCGGGWDSAGLCEGIRTGGDVGPDWQGMQPAIIATMQQLYKNHIGWWTDPDVVCVRPPLSLDQARLWATMVGITGQLLMTSDKMYALPEERVELLRRISPVADIRPMDLYPLNGRPRVFDLKVATPDAGAWDVVAAFSWNAAGDEQVRLDPAALGLKHQVYSFYDVWSKQLLAVGEQPLALHLAPMSCRVIAIRPQGATPELVGTSRHLTQGADDLRWARWNRATKTWAGESDVVAGDPYELRFTLPPGWTAAGDGVTVAGHLAVLRLPAASAGRTRWSLSFQAARPSAAPAKAGPVQLTSTADGPTLTWTGEQALAYRVYRNGELLAQLAEPRFADLPRPRKKTYTYAISAVDWTGHETARVDAGSWTGAGLPPAKAKDAWLDDLRPATVAQEYGTLQLRRSIDGNPLTLGGKVYPHGLGTHAKSEVIYDLRGAYQRFECVVGADDEKGKGLGSVVFQVWVDGEKVFDSGVMHSGDPAKTVSLPLAGAESLRLVVDDAGDGINCDHADWAEPRLIGNK